jgi:F420-dependent oxidoreductase-like protein
MVAIGVMIEGQDGLTWERWRRILQVAEELGFDSVFRSDHFVNTGPPDKPSLGLWPSLTYAANNTSRIEFGPLVTPVTFQLPAVTARNAAAVSDLSDSRLVLGIGAGWNEREHRMFGIPFPSDTDRLGMLQDYLEIVERLLRSDEPASYQGQYFQIEDAILLPRPSRPGPRILVGGNGRKRTIPLAARYADEWNAVYVTPRELRSLNDHLDALLDEVGRPRSAVRRSAMLGTVFARDEADLQGKLARRGRSAEEIREQGLVVGTPAMFVEQILDYAEAGAQRIMLQWLDQDDVEGLEVIAREVLPAVQGATAAS